MALTLDDIDIVGSDTFVANGTTRNAMTGKRCSSPPREAAPGTI